MNDDLFSTQDPKYLSVRRGLIKFINHINQVAENPYVSYEDVNAAVDFLPIHWTPEQFYLILEFLYQKHDIDNFCIAVINHHHEIVDCFVVKLAMNAEKIVPHSPFLEFTQVFLANTSENQEKITTLNEMLQQHEAITENLRNIIEETLNINPRFIFVFPYNLRDIFVNLQLPILNRDFLEFYNLLIDFYHSSVNIPSDSIYKSMLTNLDFNPNITRIATRIFSGLENIDLDRWAKIWVSLFDGILMNVVILLNQLPTLAFEIIVNDGKITINPLPTSLFSSFADQPTSAQKIAQYVQKKTGNRTVVFEEQNMTDFWDYYAENEIDYFEFLSRAIGLVYTSAWAPDSLLNSFIKLFGMEIGPGFKQIPLALRAVMEYFDSVLVIVFTGDENSSPISSTITQLNYENGKTNLKLIESANYLSFFTQLKGELPEKFQALTAQIEADLEIHFGISLGIDLQVMTESISVRNIEAFLGVSNITRQIPLIATLGGLFAGMKAVGIEQGIQEINAPLIELNEDELDVDRASFTEKMKIVSFFDEFLKKGLLCIVDESKENLKRIRSPLYSKQGYLGLDMEALRELIANQQKNDQ